ARTGARDDAGDGRSVVDDALRAHGLRAVLARTGEIPRGGHAVGEVLVLVARAGVDDGHRDAVAPTGLPELRDVVVVHEPLAGPRLRRIRLRLRGSGRPAEDRRGDEPQRGEDRQELEDARPHTAAALPAPAPLTRRRLVPAPPWHASVPREAQGDAVEDV